MRGALLFDLDGTLVQSDPLHAQVFVRMYAARGRSIDFDYYLSRIHGRQSRDSFAEAFPGEDPDALAVEKEMIFLREYAALVPPLPGIPGFIDAARAAGLATAIVTNAPRANAHKMIAAIGLAGHFDTVVLAEDCPRGKPAPDPYLAALDRLGLPAARAIAFEDSAAGIAAARAADLFTVGLQSSLAAPELAALGTQAAIRDFTDPALPALLARLKGSDE
jgi:HAD superfamily hydrolase (TIGR01509 family)